MSNRLRLPLLAGCCLSLLMAGCTGGYDAASAPEADLDVAAEAVVEAGDAAMEEAAADGAPAEGAGAIAVSLPQIAYTYSYGFRVATDGLAALQARHAEICRSKGPQVCRVMNLQQEGLEGDYASGSLQMAVAADKALALADEFAKAADEADGEKVGSSVTGEDLSKQIVDTEARLRSRRLLAERLMEVLRTRQGSVEELVAAERAVAAVNEEIDQAESWLAEMKGRVAFSDMTISYNSSAPSGGAFSTPLRDAFNSIGRMLGESIAFLITLVVALLPWAVVLGLVIAAVRRWPALRFWRRRTVAREDVGPAED